MQYDLIDVKFITSKCHIIQNSLLVHYTTILTLNTYTHVHTHIHIFPFEI